MKLETPALTTRCAAAVNSPLPHTGRLGVVRRCGRVGPARTWCALMASSVLPQRPIGSSRTAVDSMVCVLGVVRRCGWVGSGSVRRRRCPYFPSGPSGRLRQRSAAWCAFSASSVAAGGLVPALCAVGDVRTSPAAPRVVPAAVDSMVCVLGVVRRCGWVGSGSVRRRRCPYFRSGPSGRLRQRSTARCASRKEQASRPRRPNPTRREVSHHRRSRRRHRRGQQDLEGPGPATH